MRKKYVVFGPIQGGQSFTFLMADLCQDINSEFLYLPGALMEYFIEGIASLRDIGILTQMRRVTNTSLLSFNLPKPLR